MSFNTITLNILSAEQAPIEAEILESVNMIVADSQTTVVVAQRDVYYQFVSDQTGLAPENMMTKRVDDDLWVAFEEELIDNPGLVIENYYSESGGVANLLVGQAENGLFYAYVPESAMVQDAIHMLAEQMWAGQALGGGEIGAALVPWGSVALGALGVGIIGVGAYLLKDSDNQPPALGKPDANLNTDKSISITNVPNIAKILSISYTKPDGTPATAILTKDSETGQWTSNNPDVVVTDPATGEAIITAGKVENGSTVTVRAADESGKEGGPVEVSLPLDRPQLTAKEDGTVELAVPTDTSAGDKVIVELIREDGNPTTVTLTKQADGNWTSDSPETIPGIPAGKTQTTIPAASVKDGSEVGAIAENNTGGKSLPSTAQVAQAGSRPQPQPEPEPQPESQPQPEPQPPKAPSAGTVDAPDNSNDNTPTITGKGATPNTPIEVVVTDKDGNKQTIKVTSDKDGNWAATPTTPLAEGPYTAVATATNSAGIMGTAQDNGSVDVTPLKIIQVSIDINNNPKDGYINKVEKGTSSTSDITVEFEDAKAGDVIKLTNNNKEITLTEAQAKAGTVTFTGDKAIVVPDHGGELTVTANATDVAGNLSAPKSISAIVVDTEAPTAVAEITKLTDNQNPQPLTNTTGKDEIVAKVANTNGKTNDGTPYLEGKLSSALKEDETVQLWATLNGGEKKLIGTVTGAGKTDWAIQDNTGYKHDDKVEYSVVVVDKAGNPSKADTWTVEIDKEVLATTDFFSQSVDSNNGFKYSLVNFETDPSKPKEGISGFKIVNHLGEFVKYHKATDASGDEYDIKLSDVDTGLKLHGYTYDALGNVSKQIRIQEKFDGTIPSGATQKYQVTFNVLEGSAVAGNENTVGAITSDGKLSIAGTLKDVSDTDTITSFDSDTHSIVVYDNGRFIGKAKVEDDGSWKLADNAIDYAKTPDYAPGSVHEFSVMVLDEKDTNPAVPDLGLLSSHPDFETKFLDGSLLPQTVRVSADSMNDASKVEVNKSMQDGKHSNVTLEDLFGKTLPTDKTMVVQGDKDMGDTLDIGVSSTTKGWIMTGTAAVDGISYDVWQHYNGTSFNQVMVDQNINVI